MKSVQLLTTAKQNSNEWHCAKNSKRIVLKVTIPGFNRNKSRTEKRMLFWWPITTCNILIVDSQAVLFLNITFLFINISFTINQEFESILDWSLSACDCFSYPNKMIDNLSLDFSMKRCSKTIYYKKNFKNWLKKLYGTRIVTRTPTRKFIVLVHRSVHKSQ